MTTHEPAGRLVMGSLHALNGKGSVRMEDHYATDIEDLWSALTDPTRLARWIALVTGDLRLGGAFHARFTSSWDGPGRVDVCDPPRRLLLTMSPGQEDESVIEALLTPEKEGTRLVIEERGLPLSTVAGYGAGWHAHVDDLAAHLEGRTPRDWHTRWTELTPAYDELAAGLG